MKYRKRSVEIEAIRWDGDGQTVLRIRALAQGHKMGVNGQNVLFIETPDGMIAAEVGDHVISVPGGEVRVCKPALFDLTYEAIDA